MEPLREAAINLLEKKDAFFKSEDTKNYVENKERFTFISLGLLLNANNAVDPLDSELRKKVVLIEGEDLLEIYNNTIGSSIFPKPAAKIDQLTTKVLSNPDGMNGRLVKNTDFPDSKTLLNNEKFVEVMQNLHREFQKVEKLDEYKSFTKAKKNFKNQIKTLTKSHAPNEQIMKTINSVDEGLAKKFAKKITNGTRTEGMEKINSLASL